MKNKKKPILSLIWLVMGAAFFLCSVLGILDSFWSGMGGGLLAVGILQMIRHIRCRFDENYREEVDTRNRDERNLFLAGKAWSWSGSLYVIVSGVAVIVLKIAGFETASTWAAFNVCAVLVLYWGSYLYLKWKY